MNDNVFAAIKKDIERKGLYYGEIILSMKFHDGRISTYTITTTEKRNCEITTNHSRREYEIKSNSRSS